VEPVSPFVLRLPKAELHLHLEGTLTPQTVSELSRKHNTPLSVPNSRYQADPSSGNELSIGDVERLYQYKDFGGFLLAFKSVADRLRTPEDYEFITYRMMQQFHADGVLHAEVYISAGILHWRGEEFEPFFAGAERGRIAGERDFGVSVLWIIDAVRHFGVEEAQRVVTTSIALREKYPTIVGIGIGGDEAKGPAEQFREVYAFAKKNGLHLLAHAGESVGPESIWAALNIGTERIGHGLRAVEDADLMEVLAERQIPIEVCIVSNVRTGCCRKLEEHPVKKMFDAGLMVTLNSDDPPMFGTSLAREYQVAHDAFGFSDDQLRELARNSFEASFSDSVTKLKFLEQIDSL
jgi:aminodeoxyfutalosine deaminase